ncbi:cytochrome P450 oxidoreductase [Aspergillus luchuensis]|uniref:Cytochrome P450 oxidoreductase n=1 Tax=Aspergillus kawachii TaxID=1069201 RepID=A0A146FUB1_ASPKA|nr:cytochrome P450 oxidoreductase [Aspergillus luchuensis]
MKFSRKASLPPSTSAPRDDPTSFPLQPIQKRLSYNIAMWQSPPVQTHQGGDRSVSQLTSDVVLSGEVFRLGRKLPPGNLARRKLAQRAERRE